VSRFALVQCCELQLSSNYFVLYDLGTDRIEHTASNSFSIVGSVSVAVVTWFGCCEIVFTEPLPSVGRIFWLHNSGLNWTCHYIYVYISLRSASTVHDHHQVYSNPSRIVSLYMLVVLGVNAMLFFKNSFRVYMYNSLKFIKNKLKICSLNFQILRSCAYCIQCQCVGITYVMVACVYRY
jgi:hypothetical protein